MKRLSSTTEPRALGRRLAAAAVAAAALSVGLAATPSAADDDFAAERKPDDNAVAYLQLSVTGSSMNPGGTVSLTCSPDGDGGTHADPQAACDSLRAVGGDFTALPTVPDVACIDLYDPVTVSAEGLWVGGDGVPQFVDYSEEFGNHCYAIVGTDMVFQI